MVDSRLLRHPENTGSALSAAFTRLDGSAYITVIPVDSGGLVSGDIAHQAELAFDNLERKLHAADSAMDRIAHLTIYICNLAENLAAFNEVYRRRMPEGSMPIRCAVGVASLARPEMLVELTAIAETAMP